MVSYRLVLCRYSDLPGTQEIADITNLGFGPDRKLLVVDFDVSTIDLSDKKWARMEVYQTINGTVQSSFYPIGIEVKGSGIDERPKLNYAIEFGSQLRMEFRAPIETCDDDKANLFDMFEDDFEDWVLRGGYKEPTLIRDAAPSQMEGYSSTPLWSLYFVTTENIITKVFIFCIPQYSEKCWRRDWMERKEKPTVRTTPVLLIYMKQQLLASLRILMGIEKGL